MSVTIHIKSNRFAEIAKQFHNEASQVVRKTTFDVEAGAKRLAPVDTGLLRNSIQSVMEGDLTGVVFTNTEYACVFGSNTLVEAEGGAKRIANIVPGDKVLTQLGTYRTVLATPRFRALDKPNLVDLVVEWRSDKQHRLTLTDDHKVLVYREGRNKWVAAGELQPGDELYQRRKLPYNQGTAPFHVCVFCKKEFQTQARRIIRYCTLECRIKAYRTELNPHGGATRSMQSRQRMREAAQRRFQLRPDTHPSRIVAQRGHRTDAERQIQDWLIENNIAFEPQARIGAHIVDFLIPSLNSVIEADGAYWHQDQARDIERDKSLLQIDPTLSIIHIHFFDKRFTPLLERQPLPSVHYVSCNPGPASYTEPTKFTTTKILDVRHWTYGMRTKPRDPRRALLYDLTVEGVHSFVANGIVISNSFVEFGTSRQSAQPYMTPALENERHNFVRALQEIGRKLR